MPTGHLYILLGEMSIKVFCPFLTGLFVFLLLSSTILLSCLYILEIKPLSVTSFPVSILMMTFDHTYFSFFLSSIFVFFFKIRIIQVL